MKTKRRMIPCLLLFSLMAAAAPEGGGPDTDLALWEHLQRRSEVWFESYVKARTAADPGEWKAPIDAAFSKLARSSGRESFTLRYAVVNDRTFNAACFPGGQFIINTGMLAFFDEQIKKETPAGGTPDKQEDPAALRERRLAPVLAHELGHYYNRHSFNTIKKMWGLSASDQAPDIAMLKYSQENELEADRTAYLLLQGAGYDPGSIIALLSFMNSLQQEGLKASKTALFNTYLSTHPSAHRRLAEFKQGEQDWHRWAASMELAFSDIQLGRNLDGAASVIRSSLDKYPGNLYLMKALAVALHKQWLATVPLKEQRLKAVIDLPSFRDDMVPPVKRPTRGKKEIPGDKKLYYEARVAYQNAVDTALDPSFNSNYGMLLAYSTDDEDVKKALDLTLNACRVESSVPLVSNYASVLYLAGQTQKSIDLFRAVAKEFDARYTRILGEAAENRETMQGLQQLRDLMKKYQMLDREYVFGNFTPVLNLALALHYEGKGAEAVAMAGEYLSRYESASAWAKYLSALTGTRPPAEVPKKNLAVRGIRIGDPIKDVIAKWGKPSVVSTEQGGYESWLYRDIETKIIMEFGHVAGMQLSGRLSPVLENGFGIGSSRADIEKKIGSYKRISGGIYIYEGPQNMAVQYVLGVAESIILFP